MCRASTVLLCALASDIAPVSLAVRRGDLGFCRDIAGEYVFRSGHLGWQVSLQRGGDYCSGTSITKDADGGDLASSTYTVDGTKVTTTDSSGSKLTGDVRVVEGRLEICFDEFETCLDEKVAQAFEISVACTDITGEYIFQDAHPGWRVSLQRGDDHCSGTSITKDDNPGGGDVASSTYTVDGTSVTTTDDRTGSSIEGKISRSGDGMIIIDMEFAGSTTRLRQVIDVEMSVPCTDIPGEYIFQDAHPGWRVSLKRGGDECSGTSITKDADGGDLAPSTYTVDGNSVTTTDDKTGKSITGKISRSDKGNIIIEMEFAGSTTRLSKVD